MREVDQDTIARLVEKLLEIELRITFDLGPLVLFAVLERDDALGKWDLIASANWAKEMRKELLNRIALEVRNNLTWQEKLFLSRILILDTQDPLVIALNRMVPNVEHDRRRISNFMVNDILVNDAYILMSKAEDL